MMNNRYEGDIGDVLAQYIIAIVYTLILLPFRIIGVIFGIDVDDPWLIPLN